MVRRKKEMCSVMSVLEDSRFCWYLQAFKTCFAVSAARDLLK